MYNVIYLLCQHHARDDTPTLPCPVLTALPFYPICFAWMPFHIDILPPSIRYKSLGVPSIILIVDSLTRWHFSCQNQFFATFRNQMSPLSLICGEHILFQLPVLFLFHLTYYESMTDGLAPSQHLAILCVLGGSDINMGPG